MVQGAPAQVCPSFYFSRELPTLPVVPTTYQYLKYTMYYGRGAYIMQLDLVRRSRYRVQVSAYLVVAALPTEI